MPSGQTNARCSRCGQQHPSGELESALCEVCWEEMADGALDPSHTEIILETERFWKFLRTQFAVALKKQPGRLRVTLPIFSLDALRCLRLHILECVQGVSLPRVKQVAGHARGGRAAALKKWHILVDDTASCLALMGAAFTPDADFHGTGRVFNNDSFVAWHPPLTFTLSATDPEGEADAKLVVTASSARLTGSGASFARGVKTVDQPAIKRALAVSVFKVQQYRVTYPQASSPPLSYTCRIRVMLQATLLAMTILAT